jgi:hypothetical protein
MNAYDFYFPTKLQRDVREFDGDTPENAFELARRMADEHSDSLGLDDDYEDCDAEIGGLPVLTAS